MKKVLLTFLLAFLFISPCFAEKFYIENYDVRINVSSSNIMSIEEIIDTDFTRSAHGIFRSIPAVNYVQRQDGTSYKNTARIQNVRINSSYSRSREGDNFVFKIGDKSRTVIGHKRYVIKYNYILSENAKKQNEFYFNIIGNDWNTNIDKVNFEINLPKDFDKEKVGISIGKYGVAGFEDRAIFNVYDKTITGSTTKMLAPHEGITVRVELPDNYFEKSSLSLASFNCMFIAVLLAILSLAVWAFFGKDNPTISIVSFAPPKGFDAPKTSTVFNENAGDDILPVLILDLASKGYIKIEEQKGILPFDINYNIYKVKEYDKDNFEIREIFNAMFGPFNKTSTKDLAESRKFSLAVVRYKEYLNRFKNQIYEKDSISIKNTAVPFLATVLSLGNLLFVCNSYDFILIFNVCSLFMALAFIFFISAFTCFNKVSNVVKRISSMFTSLIMSIVFFILMTIQTGYNVADDPVVFLICLIGFCVSFVCLKEMPKKSPAGQKILGQILGFKKFLETVEKHKLELIMKKKPNYCYSVIPYAFALNIGGDWINKIQSMTVRPTWFVGEYNERNLRHFNNNFYHSVHPTKTGSISSHGGGGFSGGGSGGGGGGSW